MAGKLDRKRRITCDPIEHQEHLCYLIAHRRMSKAQRLIGDGRFRCEICYRVAENPENLCAPEERDQAEREA